MMPKFIKFHGHIINLCNINYIEVYKQTSQGVTKFTTYIYCNSDTLRIEDDVYDELWELMRQALKPTEPRTVDIVSPSSLKKLEDSGRTAMIDFVEGNADSLTQTLDVKIQSRVANLEQALHERVKKVEARVEILEDMHEPLSLDHNKGWSKEDWEKALQAQQKLEFLPKHEE